MPRTLLALLVAFALTLGFVAATPADASAAPGDDNVNFAKFCKTAFEKEPIPPAFERVSQGACVAFFTTGNGSATAAGICQTKAGREFAAFVTGQEFRNIGQCVVILKPFIAAEQP